MTQQPPPEQPPPYPRSDQFPTPSAGYGTPGDNSTFERSGGLMSAVVAVAVAWTVIQWLSVLTAPAAVQTYEPYQYSFSGRTAAANIVTGYDLVAMVSFLVSIAAFILTGIWLTRARRNADRIAPAEQRLTRIWVWLGWIVPIVSLWFPKRVVDDVWRSTVQSANRPDTGWWWGSWIVMQLFGGLASAAFTITGEPRGYILEHLVLLEVLTALAMTIAVVGWVRVVRVISQAQDALADGAPPPARVTS